MTILCGGGQRSGSTWQYNAVRAILREKGLAFHAAWIDDHDAGRAEPVHVVKAHEPTAMERFPDAVVVGCYRDLRDVVGSLDRMGWLSNGSFQGVRRLIDRISPLNRQFTVRRFLNRYIRSQQAWAGRAAHMTRYEDMKADPEAEVSRLAAATGFPVDPASAARIAEGLAAIRAPSEAMDRETLLHPGHIAGSERASDPQLRSFVTRHYRSWLTAHGYPVEQAAERKA